MARGIGESHPSKGTEHTTGQATAADADLVKKCAGYQLAGWTCGGGYLTKGP